MNANLFTINTIFRRPNRGIPTPHEVGMVREERQFYLFRDDMSPEVAPCENSKSEGPLEDQKTTILKEPNAVSDINEPLDLELAFWTDKYGLTEQSTGSADEKNAKVQVAPSSHNSQADIFSLITGETDESTIIGLLNADEGHTISEGTLTDTSESTSSVKNHLDMGENPDTIPISTPTGMIPHIRELAANMDSTAELVYDTPIGTIDIRGTNENKRIIADTSVAVETPGKPVSSTKALFGDGFVGDDGTTMTGDAKAAVTNTNPISAQAKSPETQSFIVETNSDNHASTDEAVSESQYPKGKESTNNGNDLSNAPGFKASSINEFQTSTDQPSGQNHSTDNNDFRPNIEQILIQKNPPVPIAEQSSTLTENARTAYVPEETPTNETSADVGKQILKSIQSSLVHRGGDQQISIRLNPPELGKVFVRFQEQNSELTGLLEINKVETRIEIEQALPQLIKDLADCGIQIRRLDIMLSEEDQSGYGAPRDQSPQNNEAREHESADSQTWDNDGSPNGSHDWSHSNKSYQPISEMHQMLFSESSINVLI